MTGRKTSKKKAKSSTTPDPNSVYMPSTTPGTINIFN